MTEIVEQNLCDLTPDEIAIMLEFAQEVRNEAFETAAQIAESSGIYGHTVSQATATIAARRIRELKSRHV